MYLVPLKTALVDALKQTFTGDYPDESMRNLYVSIEYPVQPEHYPSIWVDFEDSAPLQVAGIGHVENIIGQGSFTRVTRWRFFGYASFTVVAMSSLERDRMYDELVRTFAFSGHDHEQISEFRRHIESNEFVAMNMKFDQIEPRGSQASPGTPWGTDEVLYERTINMDVQGEFVSDGVTRTLVELSKVIVHPIEENPDGSYDDPYPPYPSDDGDSFDPTNWH